MTDKPWPNCKNDRQTMAKIIKNA